jgi:uncharacterized protein
MAEYTLPLPTITDANRPFWDSARRGQLSMQRCTHCGHIRFPINPVCTECLSDAAEWTPLSGRGEVFAKLVYHRAFNAAFGDLIPYNVVMVQLEEGPRMFSNVVGTPHDQFKVGDPVEVVFEAATDEVAIPRFKIRGRAAA